MRTPRKDLLNYVEFLREAGYLYIEGGATLDDLNRALIAQVQGGMIASADGTAPPASVHHRPTEINPSAQEDEVAAKKKSAGGGGAPTPKKSDPKATAAPTVEASDDIFAAARREAPKRGPKLSRAQRIKALAEAAQTAEACRKCKLGETRMQAVYGVGNPEAKIMFVGEAPGANEDEQGEPFVGRGGQLLTSMIQAIGFKREEVYICNTVKCRPPENRPPEDKEKLACEPFLFQQIDIIQPQMIVALGLHSAGYLTGLQISLGKMRNQWHKFRGIPVLVTYHPAFLLRSPGYKKGAWEDMQTIAARYNALNPDDQREIWKKG